MDFSAFDKSKMDDYAKRAKETWGNTSAYREFEKKSKTRKPDDEARIGRNLMGIFAEFGAMLHMQLNDETVQNQVKTLKQYITDHYYTCTDEILFSLGQMYASGGEFTQNINKSAGEGTAEFVCKAIEAYCGKQGSGEA